MSTTRDFQNGKDYPVYILKNIDYPVTSAFPPDATNPNFKLMVCLNTNALSIQVNGIDVSSKCSDGWADSIPGDGSWSITAEGAIVPVPETGELSGNDFFDLITNKESFWAAIYNPVTDTYRVGVAFFTQYNENIGNNSLYGFNVTLTGRGKIYRSVPTT